MKSIFSGTVYYVVHSDLNLKNCQNDEAICHMTVSNESYQALLLHCFFPNTLNNEINWCFYFNIYTPLRNLRVRLLTNSSESNNSYSAASQCWSTHPQWFPCAPPTTKDNSNIFLTVSITPRVAQ